MNNSSDLIKVNIKFFKKTIENIESVKKHLCLSSNPDAIGYAIKLTLTLFDEEKKGNKILIERKDGTFERLFFK